MGNIATLYKRDDKDSNRGEEIDGGEDVDRGEKMDGGGESE